jgi:uncharacterized membrane protein
VTEPNPPAYRSVSPLPLFWAVARGGPAPSGTSARILWYLAITSLVFCIAIGVIWARRVWQGLHEPEETTSNEEMLDDLRRAYAAGTMSAEEFNRVTALLTGATPAQPLQTRAVRPAKPDGEGGTPQLGDPASP